jgi:phosphoribosylglycinamide formyltransferase-1/phosphoribosylamine--glycine ligase/phosphoribosylglycinamide formyltransferase/phosphoribosylformylglycinamidine cyclo-ligase
MSPDPEIELARIRNICLALSQADERLSHGAPGFFITKGKFFAYFSHDHHGDGITAVHVKTSGREEQAMLVEMDPDFYFVPPYLGPSGWIGMRLDLDDIDWDRVADRIATSWRLIAPKRLLEANDI